MDSNWFLSATAQSTAAIIGIFSAFIITKIINNQKIYKNNLDLFVKLGNESDRLKGLNNLKIDKPIELDTRFNTEPQIRIDYHINRLNDFISSVSKNPESSNLISFSIILLLVLFFVGVILPLYMITSNPEVEIRLLNIMSFISFKRILLLIISIIFTAIMIVFFKENIRMKYDKNEIEKIEKYANIDYY